MKIGKVNDEGKGSSKKRFKIVDGDNIYRILPPLGSLADQGRWSQYWSVVWGYKNSQGQKVPFSDCRKTNYRTKMVEIESAAYLKAEKLKAALLSMKESEKRGEAVDPKALKRMEDLVQEFNIDNKHYVNAVNLQGEIGLLKIGAKAKQLIEEERKKQIAKGVDPFSIDNGRYFNIFRSGRGFNTVYQVTIYKEQRQMENGEIAEFAKVHKMDDAFISRLDSEAYDLGTLYMRPTVEQVEAIVNGADPDEVLGINRGQTDNSRVETEEMEEEYVAPVVKEEAKVEIKPVVKAEAPKPAKVEEKPAASGTSMASLSDEEFLKQMGV